MKKTLFLSLFILVLTSAYSQHMSAGRALDDGPSSKYVPPVLPKMQFLPFSFDDLIKALSNNPNGAEDPNSQMAIYEKASQAYQEAAAKTSCPSNAFCYSQFAVYYHCLSNSINSNFRGNCGQAPSFQLMECPQDANGNSLFDNNNASPATGSNQNENNPAKGLVNIIQNKQLADNQRRKEEEQLNNLINDKIRYWEEIVKKINNIRAQPDFSAFTDEYYNTKKIIYGNSNPEYYLNMYQKGFAGLDDGDGAKSIIDELLDYAYWKANHVNSPSSGALCQNAKIKIKEGNYKEAIAVLNNVISVNKNYREAYILLGISYRLLKNYPDAIDSYNKALDQYSDDASFLPIIKGYISECNTEQATQRNNNVSEPNNTNDIGSGYLNNNTINNTSLTPEALFNIGVDYYKKSDYTNAMTQFQKAAEQGFASAQCYLGVCYENGQGVTKDYQQAVKWYQKSADQGQVNAQYNLGNSYDKGEGVTQNYQEAAKWYQKAAEQGYAAAQYNLGNSYDKGEGVTQNYQEAAKWYQKAAEQGYAAAQYNLGNSYNKGEGVTQNYQEAAKWYQKAAEQGYAAAQYNLGLCFDHGQGVTQDYQQAVKWYQKAAEQGYAAAQSKIGFYYIKGQGVTQDYQQGVTWCQKAADQGYSWAQFNLGLCYENGQGVTQDYQEAVRWYQKAADQGLSGAQFNLGICYYNGRGVTQDYQEAVRWYQKAADQGLSGAQFNLGICYYNGRGVAKDYQKALAFFMKAAEQGDADSQNNLGYFYESGQGVQQDKQEAIKWYKKAAEQGNDYAKKRLEAMNQK